MFRMSSVFGACVSVCLLFFVGIAHAQDDVKDVVLKANAATMRAALADLNARRGPGWFYHRDFTTGYTSQLRGGCADMGLAPREPIATAKAFLGANRVLFGRTRKIDTFKYSQTRPLLEGTVIDLQQQYKGVPVLNAGVNVILNSDGDVRSASSNTWPIGDVDITPQVSAKRAFELISKVHKDEQVELMFETELVVLARKQGVLAWRLRVHAGPHKMPWEHLVGASTGEVLQSVSLTMNQQAPPKKKKRVSQEPLPPQQSLGSPAPCNRQWVITSPTPDDVVVNSLTTPELTYYALIDVGATSKDAAEGDNQTAAIYGAGITLLPGIEYRITVDFFADTWDSYNTDTTGFGGHWDVFFTSVNSTGFFWDVTNGSPIAECFCTENFVESSPVGPGQLWTFGGDAWQDGVLCSHISKRIFTYKETDLTKTVYLSVGLDTGRTGEVDGVFPSWGYIRVDIEASTQYFNPNPICALNDTSLTDNNDSHALIPINGYASRSWNSPLPRLADPGGLAPYTLTGDFCTIAELQPPTIAEPRSFTGSFPYLRDCTGFEAVNCYVHITEYQEYLQSLGYSGANAINNRSILVDPHYGTLRNAFYQSDGNGTGWLAFGNANFDPLYPQDTPNVDIAEDADAVMHEYAHACFDNANINVMSGSPDGSETLSINEGAADFIALSYFADESAASGFNAAVIGEWAFPENSGNGLRRADLDLKYKTDMSGSHHLQGQIISRALWDLRAALGDDRVVKILFETIKSVRQHPTFNQFVEQMLATPVDGTVDYQEIVTAFHDRGILRVVKVQAINTQGTELPFVPIEASESDVLGEFAGDAPLDLMYHWGETLTLSAPTQYLGEPLLGWSLNGGVIEPGSNSGDVTITLDQVNIPAGGFRATAVYSWEVAGDFNNDGYVTGADLGLLLGVMGTPAEENPEYDLNDDGVLDGGDLGLLLALWSPWP